ncbi:helix-turn-helix transcriptional regulator [Litoribacter alkaliphilus]|uniref:Helix-turn-helix transcriptional regulator n=1 Tax=Litoribacter ruber TaxID=702568 RepID=A0AAP2CKA4_9BACT|nr:helix-turn-helix transcriptional regulator [Litoribacter alkaliphilus]MBS9525722.1 helix-turn-helix transcriptional regulator [Litoribacter alkaliphilus]
MGNRIAELRKSKKISQEDLVEFTGFTLSQIGRIERGEVNTSISHLSKIAYALKVHPKELLDFDLK